MLQLSRHSVLVPFIENVLGLSLQILSLAVHLACPCPGLTQHMVP